MKKVTHAVQRQIVWALGMFAALTPHLAMADVISGAIGGSFGGRPATQLVGAPGGIGHMLVLPYYNTQSGNVTIFSVTNTSPTSKIVKLRVRGAANGDSLLSLTLLLGSGDVWNASLRQGAGGIAELVTTDPSCTVPRLAAGVAQPLSTSRLNNPSWTAPDRVAQTREGYVELITMADVLSDSGLQNAIASRRCDDAVIDAATVSNNFTSPFAAMAQGLRAPSGSLGGKWIIINVPQTTTYTGSMYAIRAVDANGAEASGNFVLFPQNAAPYSGTINDVTADPLMRSAAYSGKDPDGTTTGATANPAIATTFADLPDMSTPYVVAPGPNAALDQAARLTAAMGVVEFMNEFTTEPTITAKTDWVISMPARRYSVAMDYATAAVPRALFSLVPAAGTQYFHGSSTKPSASNPAQLCTQFPYYVFYDRNAHYIKATPSQPQPGIISMSTCGVVSVLSFGNEVSSAVGAEVAHDMVDVFGNGWGSMASFDPFTQVGLPVIGSAFIKVNNPAASPGISGNYGITFEHWLTRR